MVLLSSTMLKSSLIPSMYISLDHLSRLIALIVLAECTQKGIYKRKIKHPVLQDGTCIIFIVSQRKWKCTNCSTYVNEDFPFFQRYKQSSDITPLLVFRGYEKTLIVLPHLLPDNSIYLILKFTIFFTAYVDLPRLTLPEFLSVDEVHIDISEKEKYALILMDFYFWRDC